MADRAGRDLSPVFGFCHRRYESDEILPFVDCQKHDVSDISRPDFEISIENKALFNSRWIATKLAPGLQRVNVEAARRFASAKLTAVTARWCPAPELEEKMEMIKNLKERDEKGFTLIELLVVVAIIGILAAIAIPQFSAYREQGFDAQASSHLRNIALAQEAYFAQNASYASAVADLAPAVQVDTDIPVTVALVTGGFTLEASHTNGGKTFNWNSTLGGLQDSVGDGS